MPATKTPDTASFETQRGEGGETHQRVPKKGPHDGEGHLTTNQGIRVSDNQNQLKAGARGPVLLEDFALREKIFHFDHERIPERIVHARGSAAHGFFELYDALADITKADLFQRPGEKTPVFTRFSTVAGGAGSVDTPRDVRGFAVKFYTQEGNWDLVGNNIPIFFIQDAIKFPDLIHAVKMEADRGFPQAASAHDTFWNFVSLMPETTHMLMWAMSDRTIPRSLRMIEGFGIHTFRFVNAKGKSTLVKFHWKPKLGLQSTVWDEALKLQAADNDYHRRDLFESIQAGDFPEWELGLQLFDQKFADAQPYDVLDPTKIIPEEVVPVRLVGRMVLNRWPDNFFAETEQVAYCPANIVPGIDFTNDPLLQGRLFSYLDTQKSRLGTANFHQLPINAPKCPMANFQRDGQMQMSAPIGRANYEPNSLAAHGEEGGPRECPVTGFVSFVGRAEDEEQGDKLRVRAELFADHYSQARLFWLSQTDSERAHIASSFVFELSKVQLEAVPARMLANLRNVDETLAKRVAAGLGADLPKKAPPARPPIDMKPSPALSIQQNMKEILKGRQIGVLIDDGSDAAALAKLRKGIEKAGAKCVLVVARQRFGALTGESGAIWTRTGRAFFAESDTRDAVLQRLRDAVSSAGLWEELKTDWLLLDVEIMPWSAKASALIENQYAPVAASANAGINLSLDAATRAAARGVAIEELRAKLEQRATRAALYGKAWAPYVWPVSSVDDLRVAPFHILASEGAVHFGRDHLWHMSMADRLAEDSTIVSKTKWRSARLEDADAVAEAIEWWEALIGSGGEGMVVKPREFIARGAKGLIQPALKVRGKEYLRIIYGPEYDAPEHLERLKQRGLGGKRALALKEFALGHEALSRFVARQPLRRVHECVFGVLALESEPIDPRL